MLSETALVRMRAAIESLYDATCKVIEHRKVVNENHTTSFEDKEVYKDQACRLSFSSILEYKSSGQPTAHVTHQEINLDIFKGWS